MARESRIVPAWSLLLRALLGAMFLVSCHAILGLEDKREVQNYGTAGYAGCRNGTCDQCLRPADKCQCQGKNPDCSSKTSVGSGDAGLDGQAPMHSGCAGVGTCFDQCVCNGGSSSVCLAQCADGGGSTTTGGDSGSQSMGDAAVNGVCQPPDCTGCSTAARTCTCQGGSADDCLSQLLGKPCATYFSGDDCNSCACSSCAVELLGCFDDSGCIAIAQCMRITGCAGIGCDSDATCKAVLDAHGGRAGSAFVHASALQRCRGDNACACGTMGDTSVISCDTNQCSPYTDSLAPSSALAACCFTQQARNFCGLSVSSVLYSGCEPLNQTGRQNTSCPGFQTAHRFPYHGAFLDGCCRPTTGAVAMNGGTGACGYNDNITGLGCLPPHVVDGVTTMAQDCVYTP